MSTPNNPPAFPVPVAITENGELVTISLRDYVAAKVLTRLINRPADTDWHNHCAACAIDAYAAADAVLEERCKTK